ncbi:hypothetical protein C2845_PM07G39680 [Panicum miliaceum]|uniref:Uncharacterized protein n=1 Tax=Panicum miliaceum TaxID=4540 RepID=A0A3L6SQV3_PANMI|nr:hypothetical protein C2845_PM07G39680 [Panicum miliaceum]
MIALMLSVSNRSPVSLAISFTSSSTSTKSRWSSASPSAGTRRPPRRRLWWSAMTRSSKPSIAWKVRWVLASSPVNVSTHPSQKPRRDLPHRGRDDELLQVRDHPPQPLTPSVAVEPVIPVAERGARDGGLGVGDEGVAEVDHAASLRGADVGDQRGGLLLPDAAEGAGAARAEEAEHADAARLAPVLAVGREGDVAGAVDEAVGHGHPGPAGEGRVAGPQGLLRGRRRGRHDGGRAAEAQQHDRAV